METSPILTAPAAERAGWRGTTPRLGVRLADGTPVVLRPVLPTDRRHLVRGLARMSAESRYRRFLTPMPRFTPWHLRYLTEVDQREHLAWAVFVREAGGWAGVAVGRCVRLADDPSAAEFALTVVDDHQGRGLGRLLLGTLALLALPAGVERFVAEVLASNAPMTRLLDRAGATVRPLGGGVVGAELPVAALPARLLADGVRRALRRLLAGGPPIGTDVGIGAPSAHQ